MTNRREIGAVLQESTHAVCDRRDRTEQRESFRVHENGPSGIVPGTQLRGAAAGPSGLQGRTHLMLRGWSVLVSMSILLLRADCLGTPERGDRMEYSTIDPTLLRLGRHGTGLFDCVHRVMPPTTQAHHVH